MADKHLHEMEPLHRKAYFLCGFFPDEVKIFVIPAGVRPADIAPSPALCYTFCLKEAHRLLELIHGG